MLEYSNIMLQYSSTRTLSVGGCMNEADEIARRLKRQAEAKQKQQRRQKASDDRALHSALVIRTEQVISEILQKLSEQGYPNMTHVSDYESAPKFVPFYHGRSVTRGAWVIGTWMRQHYDNYIKANSYLLSNEKLMWKSGGGRRPREMRYDALVEVIGVLERFRDRI
jgi:hypothetical protein